MTLIGAFDGLREVFASADVRFVNLEGPLSGSPRSADEPDGTNRTGRTATRPWSAHSSQVA